MDLDTYQLSCRENFNLYPADKMMYLLVLHLFSEVGEVAGKYGKIYRGDPGASKEQVLDELGDVLWYVGQIFHEQGKWLSSTYALSLPHKPHGSLDPDYLMMRLCEKAGNVVRDFNLQSIPNEFDCSDHMKYFLQTFRTILDHYKITAEELADRNWDKLQDRAKRNQIEGSGDNR